MEGVGSHRFLGWRSEDLVVVRMVSRSGRVMNKPGFAPFSPFSPDRQAGGVKLTQCIAIFHENDVCLKREWHH